MNSAYLPYLITEAFCIAYTATISFHLKSEVGSERELASLRNMVTAYIVTVAADIVCVLQEHIFVSGPRVLTAVFNGISLAAVAVGCYLWYQFVELRLKPGAVRRMKAERLIRIPLYFVCALDLLSSFTGWVFYISADGMYMLGKLFWVQGVITFAYLLIPTVHAVYCAFTTPVPQKRGEYLNYVVYICVCFAVVWVEDSIPTVPIFELSIFGVIQILFLTLYLDREHDLAEKQRQQTEANAAVMLSQLQPHFLFNALMAIQDMCHDKAPEAEEAVVEFAEYLRGNLDSLRRLEPIPFRQELNHTENYLALENKRFGGKIRVEYDIRAEEFSMPALTLQSLVENAVRYGVTQRVEGGSVRITSEEKDGAYRVTVQDDGVGFDPANVKPDGRNHIGIHSVRSRLMDMCGGSLSVESVPGEGTTAVISIPERADRD